MCFIFCCFFMLIVHVLCHQDYAEEFREIAGGKSKKSASSTIEGITLINQRHVGDDLPVNVYFFILLFFFFFMVWGREFFFYSSSV